MAASEAECCEPVSAEVVGRLIHARQQAAPKRLVNPGPTAAQLQAYFAAAAAAPDHGQLSPWRFVIVPSEARDRLARAFADALLQRTPDALPNAIDDARRKAYNAPFLALAIARLGGEGQDTVPARERLVSLGAALQNVLLSASADGFGCGLVSGQSLQSKAVRRLFTVSHDEVAICFMAIGTVNIKKPARQRSLPERFVTTLDPSPALGRPGCSTA